eukprot:COSAG02_NODE_4042_length_5868_cov_9.128445_6_plen_151_part_00
MASNHSLHIIASGTAGTAGLSSITCTMASGSNFLFQVTASTCSTESQILPTITATPRSSNTPRRSWYWRELSGRWKRWSLQSSCLGCSASLHETQPQLLILSILNVVGISVITDFIFAASTRDNTSRQWLRWISVIQQRLGEIPVRLFSK